MILPKFDSSGSLIFGAVISLLLFVLNLVSIVIGRHDSFFPFQLTRVLGMAVGIALGIHCLDMKSFYAKRPRREGRDRTKVKASGSPVSGTDRLT